VSVAIFMNFQSEMTKCTILILLYKSENLPIFDSQGLHSLVHFKA